MLKRQSIPDQMDILAIYELLLNEEGNLLGFERKGMCISSETEVKEKELIK